MHFASDPARTFIHVFYDEIWILELSPDNFFSSSSRVLILPTLILLFTRSRRMKSYLYGRKEDFTLRISQIFVELLCLHFTIYHGYISLLLPCLSYVWWKMVSCSHPPRRLSLASDSVCEQKRHLFWLSFHARIAVELLIIPEDNSFIPMAGWEQKKQQSSRRNSEARKKGSRSWKICGDSEGVSNSFVFHYRPAPSRASVVNVRNGLQMRRGMMSSDIFIIPNEWSWTAVAEELEWLEVWISLDFVFSFSCSSLLPLN